MDGPILAECMEVVWITSVEHRHYTFLLELSFTATAKSTEVVWKIQKIKIQNSKFKFQIPKFKIQTSNFKNSKLKIQNPKSQIQNLKSKIQNSKFIVPQNGYAIRGSYLVS